VYSFCTDIGICVVQLLFRTVDDSTHLRALIHAPLSGPGFAAAEQRLPEKRRLRAPVLAAPPITCCRSVPCTTLAALERPATCSATILAVPGGLWPSYPRGNGPACCNDPDFDNGPGLITPQVGKSMHLDLKKKQIGTRNVMIIQ
jgi:hypothetical protein